ncbi:MAG: cytochrome c oxidase assembly protein [Ilumatobacter sp.]|nr:cytochrome c oxidase assembly protein [Ilumatobacter sp.]
MLIAASVLAHDGAPVQPHDVWSAWRFDPFVLVGLLVAAALYVTGCRSLRNSQCQTGAFLGGLAVIALALLSPIDAMSAVLMSAHMVQHVLLMFVAAPLIAVSVPGPVLLRGLPTSVRRRFVSTRHAFGLVHGLHWLRDPLRRWLLFVAVLWLWHASLLYEAAVANDWVHIVEHASFIATALLLWSSILGTRRSRLPDGLGVLAVFSLMMQGVVLAALITFSQFSWYEPYARGAPGWGIDALTDQRLAGLLMWFPTSLIHLIIAGVLLANVVAESTGPSRRTVVEARSVPVGALGSQAPAARRSSRR